MSNVLLQKYAKYKKQVLENSPYKCLLDTDIDINPHQVNAFCAAIQALKTGGLILADEVGLGKTIEAGLVLKYIISSGAKRILLALPSTLRKQWEVELAEKFNLQSVILDRLMVEKDYYASRHLIVESKNLLIAITSYDYSAKLMKRFPEVKWDYIVIDEAHNLRNVFHGTKRARRLYDLSKGIPKILLTATPLQNSLLDLHGLVSFVDGRIFGSEKVFTKRYIEGQDYSDLKTQLAPVLYRTLRKDVSKYMNFRNRECRTVDFTLSIDEIALYQRVNAFLKKDTLYSIPTANRGLVTLVIRKLLASSSFALVDTFEILKGRLAKLYEGTRSADAQEGFDMFWEYVEDEIDEEGFSEESDDIIFQKQCIQEEIDEVQAIIDTAEKITVNAKIKALMTALSIAFDYQAKNDIPQKAIIFTESKRTQKYIAKELRGNGYAEEDIVLFNGDFDDAMTKEIYRTWQVKNFGKTNYGKSIEYKHAIVEYFRDNAKILIVTDAGSEGLNLQFCNTVINYDLPWNPQKIEQRIGRCHRYGQQHDVVAINLLNRENEADRRVYDILSRKFELFEGVFGASDKALGILESGFNFEKMVLDIYQRCDTAAEFKKEFDKLDRAIDSKRDIKVVQLRDILLSKDSTAKVDDLDATKRDIDRYLSDIQYWNKIEDEDILEGGTSFLRTDSWGMDCFNGHGYLCVGAMCNGCKVLFPVLLLCDENGEYIDFDEQELIPLLEQLDDFDIFCLTMNEQEHQNISRIYEDLTRQMLEKYRKQIDPLKEYNKLKVENWAEIQTEQLNIQISDMAAEVLQLNFESAQAKEFLEKLDIKKKAAEKQKQLEKLQESFHSRVSKIQEEAQQEIEHFNKQLEINPMLVISVVLKF